MRVKQLPSNAQAEPDFAFAEVCPCVCFVCVSLCVCKLCVFACMCLCVYVYLCVSQPQPPPQSLPLPLVLLCHHLPTCACASLCPWPPPLIPAQPTTRHPKSEDDGPSPGEKKTLDPPSPTLWVDSAVDGCPSAVVIRSWSMEAADVYPIARALEAGNALTTLRWAPAIAIAGCARPAPLRLARCALPRY